MRQLISLIFTLLTFIACGQTVNDKVITNVKTDKHINIPGTRLYIIPPDSFKLATSFIGLQKDNNAMIQVMDIVGGNFNSNAATFNKAAFEEKGIKVFDYQEFTINGFSAKYIYMQGKPTVKAYDLVFGDATFSTMIMAYCSADDKKTEAQIKDALLSVTYDKNLKTDPMANASFLLNDSNSKFKFFKSSTGLYIYSIDGIEDTSGGGAPMILVTPFPYEASMTPETVSVMVLIGFEKHGFTDKEIKNKSTEKVNGYMAIEEEIYGKMNGKNCVIYQLIVADKDKAIAIQGITTSNFESNITEFKKLAHTVKFK
jgi:hypothetical protein